MLNEFEIWRLCVKEFRKAMRQISEEKKQRALERRQQLSALSRELKAVAELTGEAENVNELLKGYYSTTYGTTDLRTFEEWKKAGYTVKKGQTSFMIWATPKATKAERERVAEAKAKGEHATEKEDYFPVCHLFDIKQVHTITK